MGWLVNKLIAFLCSCSVPSHLVAGLSEPRADEEPRGDKESERAAASSVAATTCFGFFFAPFVLDMTLVYPRLMLSVAVKTSRARRGARATDRAHYRGR